MISAFSVFAWTCAVYMCAVGSVHLSGPYALMVFVRVLGFGSLVMVSHNIASVVWDINS